MTRGEIVEDKLTYSVIGAFFEVYNTLGFGFLEHLYVMAFERELLARGHLVGREVSVPVMYKGDELGTQRLDMIVDGILVVEIKSTIQLHQAAQRQVYNYLRATSLKVGYSFTSAPSQSSTESSRARANRRQHDIHPFDPTNPKHPNNLSSSTPA